MSSFVIDDNLPPTDLQARKPRRPQHPCLECRRTNLVCDEVRPVCGTCVREKGLTRCWLRSARRKRTQDHDAPKRRKTRGAEGSPENTLLSVTTGSFDDGSVPASSVEIIEGMQQLESTFNPSNDDIHIGSSRPTRTSTPNSKPSSSKRRNAAELTHRRSPVNEKGQISYSTAIYLVHTFLEKIQPW